MEYSQVTYGCKQQAEVEMIFPPLHITDINLTLMLSCPETIWLTLSVYFSLPTTDYPWGVSCSGQYLHNTSRSPLTCQSSRFSHSKQLADVLLKLPRCIIFIFGCFLCGRVGISIAGIFAAIFVNRMCDADDLIRLCWIVKRRHGACSIATVSICSRSEPVRHCGPRDTSTM